MNSRERRRVVVSMTVFVFVLMLLFCRRRRAAPAVGPAWAAVEGVERVCEEVLESELELVSALVVVAIVVVREVLETLVFVANVVGTESEVDGVEEGVAVETAPAPNIGLKKPV